MLWCPPCLGAVANFTSPSGYECVCVCGSLARATEVDNSAADFDPDNCPGGEFGRSCSRLGGRLTMVVTFSGGAARSGNRVVTEL